MTTKKAKRTPTDRTIYVKIDLVTAAAIDAEVARRGYPHTITSVTREALSQVFASTSVLMPRETSVLMPRETSVLVPREDAAAGSLAKTLDSPKNPPKDLPKKPNGAKS